MRSRCTVYGFLLTVCVCMVLGAQGDISEAGCGACTSGETEGVFKSVFEAARVNEGIREISYDDLERIRRSGEPHVLLDVLGSESYAQGHIPGARSFPLDTITEQTVAERLRADVPVVVYCGSVQCQASTQAAKKLSTLGYTVVDYKGGLKEWTEKGRAVEPVA